MPTPPQQQPLITIPITGDDLLEYRKAADAVGEEELHRLMMDSIRKASNGGKPPLRLIGEDEEESE